MAALDPEIRQGIESRDARRAHIAQEILKRTASAGKKNYNDERFKATADAIAMLAGFATYDALAAAGHSDQQIIAMVAHLVHVAASDI